MNQANRHSEEMNSADLERYRDAEWAINSSEVQRRYNGQWVVAYERQGIAHGADPAGVVAKAQEIVSGVAHRVIFCTGGDEDAPLWDCLDTSCHFTDG